MTEHEPPEDRELEDFLAGRSPLSRVYKEGAQNQAAPPELDAPVLAKARAELQQARRSRRLLRWDSPFALAASMVLVLGLGWLVQHQVPRPAVVQAAPSAQVLDEASAARAGPPAPSALPPKLAAPMPRQASEDKALKDGPARDKRERAPPPGPAAFASAPGAAVPDQALTAAPVLPAESVAEKPSAVAAAELRQDSARKAAESAGLAPMQAAPGRQPEPFPAAPTAALSAEKPSVLAAQGERDALSKRKQTAAAAGVVAADAPAPVAAPAPQPAPPAAQRSENAYSSEAAAVAPAAAPAGVQDMTASAACESPQRLPAQRRARPERNLDAPGWLEQIRGLRDAADAGAARAELACFRARYPQAPVPEELKALLPP